MTVASFQAKDAAGNNVSLTQRRPEHRGETGHCQQCARRDHWHAKVITDARDDQQYLRGLVSQWISGTLVVGAGIISSAMSGPSCARPRTA